MISAIKTGEENALKERLIDDAPKINPRRFWTNIAAPKVNITENTSLCD